MTDQKAILFIENKLNIQIPNSYKNFLINKGKDIVFGLPLLGLPATDELSSSLGATLVLRALRPELKKYLAVRIYEERILCLDLINDNKIDAPLVEVDINSAEQPVIVHNSFDNYLNESEKSKKQIEYGLNRIENLYSKKLVKTYDRKNKDGKIPFKARDWRIHRSCVHDRVVGLTAFKYNEYFNGIEVDVFLSTDHPDYEAGHGIKALLLLIFSDAYRNGTSMEIRFTQFEEHSTKNRIKDEIPIQLVQLFKDSQIKISELDEALITHKESVNLYEKIIGIDGESMEKVYKLEKENKLSMQGVCYLIASRIWMLDEVSWILLNSPRPEGILFGKDTPEKNLMYEESLNWGRAALAITKLRHKLENSLNIENEKKDNGNREGDTTIRIENFVQHIAAHQTAILDWLITPSSIKIEIEEEITVLARPRRFYPLPEQLIKDDAKILKKNSSKNRKFLLYNEDFLKIENCKKIADLLKKNSNIELLILPYNTNEIDEEINNRMKKSRIIRT